MSPGGQAVWSRYMELRERILQTSDFPLTEAQPFIDVVEEGPANGSAAYQLYLLDEALLEMMARPYPDPAAARRVLREVFDGFYRGYFKQENLNGGQE